MIKGALFDVDDTLYSHTINAVPKATLKALDKLREKGIKIGICTSRVMAEMESFPQELLDKIDCKIIGTGATTVVEGEYFKSYTIDKEYVRKYIDLFEKNNVSYHYTDINGDLYYWGNLDLVNNGTYLRFANGNVKFKQYEDEDITNLFYYHAPEDLIEEINNVNPEALISRWGSSGNICASLVDKSFGLLKFCQVFSFTTDEIVAAGDGGNDDVMLKMAGIGIAVDDAKDNTKKAADYVCKKPIEEGGLYDAFVDLGLIEEDRYDIKMFAFDNDSTLFDHSIGKVRDKSFTALEKLKEKGYKLCLNTSRSLQECYNIPERLMKMMNGIILLNGAYVIKDGKTEVSYLPEDLTKKLITYFDENDLTYRYCLDNGKGYLNRHDADKEALFKKLYDVVPEVKKYEGEKVIHILYYATGELREKIIRMAEGLECCRLGISGEISPAGKNKGLSLLALAKEYGIDRKQICAFGDGGNDIEMLKHAGLGIAMGNGYSECKYAADYVTDHISDEGIYNALIHFGFIEE